MGVAAGDFNNDGCVDLYVTKFGRQPAVPQQLRRHVHRRLEGEPAPTIPAGACSAAFVDFDRDGWLDLFVGHYLQLQHRDEHARASASHGDRDYCPPHVYSRAAEPPVSQQPRRHVHRRHRALRACRASSVRRSASSTADFNGDGWIDIYVANDGQPNQLWINQHNGTFKNTALLAGVGAERRGQAPRRAWAWTPAISTTTATRISSSPS